MTITQFHDSLGAPVKNTNWSWGSQRKIDGAVFLRVWNDETRTIDGAKWAMVAHHVPDGGANFGYRERMEHLRQVQSGARCLLVLLDAKDPSSNPGPRKIFKFDAGILGVGGDIRTEDDRTWIRIVGYKMVRDILLHHSGV
jgi:hypothetical protein